MSIADFNPDIAITVTPSIYRRIFKVFVNNMPPNEIFECWFFDPDGDNIGQDVIKSDNQGNGINRPEYGSAYFAESGSQPIKKGIHYFGMNKIKYNNRGDKHRMSLGIWKELPGDKKLVDFVVDYEKPSILTLHAEKKVPWGINIKVSGKLWHGNEPFPGCSGAVDFIGKKIILDGNHIDLSETQTNGFSEFSTEIRVGNEPRSDCFIQAHYEGDPIFFDKCDSDRIYYELTKHRTGLEMVIDDLRLKSSGFVEGRSSDSNLESYQPFRIRCTLLDNEINAGIGEKLINFETDLPFKLPTTLTVRDGTFIIDNVYAPNIVGNYFIKAKFPGDSHYEVSELQLGITVREKIHSPTNISESLEPSGLIIPDEPFGNELKFKKVLRSCSGYINWVDKYFNSAGLELLYFGIDRNSIKDIRILVPIQVASENLRNFFKKFQKEMSGFGINSDMRVIVESKLISSIHDRWILSDGKSYNIPSVDVIKRGQYSEIKETDSQIPFQDWWNKGLDLISDWNKIKDNLRSEKLSTRSVGPGPYQQSEKLVNEKVYRKLLELDIEEDSLSHITLKARNEFYDKLPYILHAENMLLKYSSLYEKLSGIKEIIDKYNMMVSQLRTEIPLLIVKEMKIMFPNITDNQHYTLDVPNSYSLSTFTELTYDFCTKAENSEIALAEKRNFDSASNDSFGWVLLRIVRGAGVSTADTIMTSQNQNDTDPIRVLTILKEIGSSDNLKYLTGELRSLRSRLIPIKESFTRELRKLSECIDLDIPYSESPG